MVPNPPHNLSFRFLLIWGVSALLEFPLALALITDNHVYLETYPRFTLALHACAALMLFFAFPRGRGWFKSSRLWARNAVILTLFLPVFGWLLTGLLVIVYRPPQNPEDVFDFEGADVAAAEIAGVGMGQVLISREERLFRELDFMPLADILAGSDSNLKRGAIDKLARLGTAEAVAVLMRHRGDSQPEVRFYVTSALTGVKKRYDEELDAAQKRMKRQVHDVVARVDLAKTYLRYAQSGLLDEATERAYENEAVRHLQAATRAADAPRDACLTLIDVLRSRGAWNEALDVLERFEKSGFAKPASLLQARIEILYGAGRYAEVREELSELKAAGIDDPAWQAAIHLWGAA